MAPVIVKKIFKSMRQRSGYDKSYKKERNWISKDL